MVQRRTLLGPLSLFFVLRTFYCVIDEHCECSDLGKLGTGSTVCCLLVFVIFCITGSSFTNEIL